MWQYWLHFLLNVLANKEFLEMFWNEKARSASFILVCHDLDDDGE